MLPKLNEFITCKEAIEECLASKRFAIAHLYNEELTMNMHIHNCYEIYYSISGGKKFLIDNKCYDIVKGDIFVINNFESHYLSQIDAKTHERIVFSIFPEYLTKLSSEATDLSYCFARSEKDFNHRVHLDKEAQSRFLYLVRKITGSSGYGSDLKQTAAFTELMILINSLYHGSDNENDTTSIAQPISEYQYNEIVSNIIEFINENIFERITIPMIASNFFLSEAYICRLFKSETGTTINKYLTARRISIAKAKLSQGASVTEACEQSGFNDYTNFVHVFSRIVGVTPKKFSKGMG